MASESNIPNDYLHTPNSQKILQYVHVSLNNTKYKRSNTRTEAAKKDKSLIQDCLQLQQRPEPDYFDYVAVFNHSSRPPVKVLVTSLLLMNPKFHIILYPCQILILYKKHPPHPAEFYSPGRKRTAIRKSFYFHQERNIA